MYKRYYKSDLHYQENIDRILLTIPISLEEYGDVACKLDIDRILRYEVLKKAIIKALDKLTEIERCIIEKRYGEIKMTDTVNRFLRYVKIDTQSEEGHETTPSTAKQFDLARLLVSELEELGAKDVYLDEQLCYVYAKIPSNTDNECPKLGFIAHMDTSPAVSDENVDPVITENYDGKALMTTKYCLRYELGCCLQGKNSSKPQLDIKPTATLLLRNNDRRFRLDFDCQQCQMLIYKEQ